MTQSKYQCALITGASAGLGEEFARQLAPECESIILVARRGEAIQSIANSLSDQYPALDITCKTIDLLDEKGILQLINEICSETIKPDLLINNAGMGDLGAFPKSDWEKLNAMLQLNMTVVTRLAHAVVPGMIKRGGGSILNVSSMASLIPIPDFTAYAATKAYVTSFSEALRMELNEHHIKVTTLCPGPVHTEFGDVATRSPDRKDIPMSEGAYVDKEQVVSEGLSAMRRNQARIFPGRKIKLYCFALRWTPLPLIRLIMSKRPRRID